jgi:hypothetical protein
MAPERLQRARPPGSPDGCLLSGHPKAGVTLLQGQKPEAPDARQQ